jgi:hypothetical protein
MEDEEKTDPTDLYDGMAQEVAERDVDEDAGVEHKSIEEEEASTQDISDFKFTLHKLFPQLGTEIDNAIMVARVAPDMFIPMLRILVNAEIKRTSPNKPLNIGAIASKYYVLASIGLDGKGRIDSIEMAGAAKETEELEKLSKGLGGY